MKMQPDECSGQGASFLCTSLGLGSVHKKHPAASGRGAEHDKGPEPRSETPALFPLPQKRCGYYSDGGPGHSEGPESRNVANVGAPTHDRSRCDEHGESCHSALGGVLAPPGVVMVAPPEVPRNAEGGAKRRPR